MNIGTSRIQVLLHQFYKIDNKILTLPCTVIPKHPTVHHKSHIEKVMFLVAMGRPQTRPDGTFFDGKIGIWPCTEEVAALKNSRNRPKGTLVTKPKSVDGTFYFELLSEPGGVLDKVKEKLFWLKDFRINIQQDGAKPHASKVYSNRLAELGRMDGWNIVFVTQPAQSPDLNILDLGFFRSLKSRVDNMKLKAYTVDELIDKVKRAYSAYDAETLDHIWKNLFHVYNLILANDGGNQFKLTKQRTVRRLYNHQTFVDLTIDVINYNRVFNMYSDN